MNNGEEGNDSINLFSSSELDKSLRVGLLKQRLSEHSASFMQPKEDSSKTQANLFMYILGLHKEANGTKYNLFSNYIEGLLKGSLEINIGIEGDLHFPYVFLFYIYEKLVLKGEYLPVVVFKIFERIDFKKILDVESLYFLLPIFEELSKKDNRFKTLEQLLITSKKVDRYDYSLFSDLLKANTFFGAYNYKSDFFPFISRYFKLIIQKQDFDRLDELLEYSFTLMTQQLDSYEGYYDLVYGLFEIRDINILVRYLNKIISKFNSIYSKFPDKRLKVFLIILEESERLGYLTNPQIQFFLEQIYQEVKLLSKEINESSILSKYVDFKIGINKSYISLKKESDMFYGIDQNIYRYCGSTIGSLREIQSTVISYIGNSIELFLYEEDKAGESQADQSKLDNIKDNVSKLINKTNDSSGIYKMLYQIVFENNMNIDLNESLGIVVSGKLKGIVQLIRTLSNRKYGDITQKKVFKIISGLNKIVYSYLINNSYWEFDILFRDYKYDCLDLNNVIYNAAIQKLNSSESTDEKITAITYLLNIYEGNIKTNNDSENKYVLFKIKNAITQISESSLGGIYSSEFGKILQKVYSLNLDKEVLGLINRLSQVNVNLLKINNGFDVRFGYLGYFIRNADLIPESNSQFPELFGSYLTQTEDRFLGMIESLFSKVTDPKTKKDLGLFIFEYEKINGRLWITPKVIKYFLKTDKKLAKYMTEMYFNEVLKSKHIRSYNIDIFSYLVESNIDKGFIIKRAKTILEKMRTTEFYSLCYDYENIILLVRMLKGYGDNTYYDKMKEVVSKLSKEEDKLCTFQLLTYYAFKIELGEVRAMFELFKKIYSQRKNLPEFIKGQNIGYFISALPSDSFDREIYSQIKLFCIEWKDNIKPNDDNPFELLAKKLTNLKLKDYQSQKQAVEFLFELIDYSKHFDFIKYLTLFLDENNTNVVNNRVLLMYKSIIQSGKIIDNIDIIKVLMKHGMVNEIKSSIKDVIGKVMSLDSSKDRLYGLCILVEVVVYIKDNTLLNTLLGEFMKGIKQIPDLGTRNFLVSNLLDGLGSHPSKNLLIPQIEKLFSISGYYKDCIDNLRFAFRKKDVDGVVRILPNVLFHNNFTIGGLIYEIDDQSELEYLGYSLINMLFRGKI